MGVFRSRQDGRLAAADTFPFPGGLRQRFAYRHTELTSDGLRSVEAGTRQWFRLGARHPRARLAMPSVIVGEYTREFALHYRDYTEFCTAVLGHPLPPEAVTTDQSRLGITFRLAQEDEVGAPGSLPLLFRVDRELAVVGGRYYLADCGGRGTCYELKDTICLQHLGGLGRKPGSGIWKDQRHEPEAGGVTTCGCGG
jgi:hypothetical protein